MQNCLSDLEDNGYCNLDEFAYAVEPDTSRPSHLQAAWDHLVKERPRDPIALWLAHQHDGRVAQLQRPHGRMTDQFPTEPLPFAALNDLFSCYLPAERVALDATVGGRPAYQERIDPGQPSAANIKEHLFQHIGLFRNKPAVIISYLVRKTRQYEAVLRAITAGQHTVRNRRYNGRGLA